MNKTISFVRLDFAAIKPYIKTLYLFVIIAIFTGIIDSSLDMTFTMVMIGLPMILSYPFAISEKNSLDTLYSTLSLNRKDVVLGRYAFAFIIEIVAIMILLALAFIKSNFSTMDMSFNELFIYISFLSMIFSIIIAFQYPIFFKFGYAKAKLFSYIPLLLLFLLLGVIPTIAMKLNVNINWDKLNSIFIENTRLMFYLPLLIGLASLFISYMVSAKIYMKKDI